MAYGMAKGDEALRREMKANALKALTEPAK